MEMNRSNTVRFAFGSEPEAADVDASHEGGAGIGKRRATSLLIAVYGDVGGGGLEYKERRIGVIDEPNRCFGRF
ncbi:aldehyde-activating protein [Sesbania bispinosa]|nr:aldehyde-activating protein [Sesbania bispinosa]